MKSKLMAIVWIIITLVLTSAAGFASTDEKALADPPALRRFGHQVQVGGIPSSKRIL